MPEGPEVRRAADRIEKALKGSVIQKTVISYPTLNSIEHLILGARLMRVDTYGKAFVLIFDSGIAIYVHLQLYGVWKTGKITQEPNTTRSLRIRLESNKKYAALYSATNISVHLPKDIPSHPYIQKLGPDLLSSGYKACHISRRLHNKEFSRKSLGSLLLQQSFFAGIGNYLRSEILFIAKLHPSQKVGTLSKEKRTLLAQSIHNTTVRAYQTGGITTSAEYTRQAKSKRIPRYRYRHYVFAQEGRPCPSCKSTIKKIDVGGRRLYFCPTCQAPA